MIYGYDRTIHRTGEVNVEIGPDGEVCSVWFRCAMLPFTQSVVNQQRADEMHHAYQDPPPSIQAIDFQDREEPSLEVDLD